MRIKILTGIFMLLTASVYTADAQDRAPAFAMNARLGRGINMGNSFEAPSETAWGNPWKPGYFKTMADLGFQHVRLPVNWETASRSLAVAPYTIDADFLNRIEEVVNHALKNKLHIIINMHHHEALFEDPQAQRARFISQWKQIAERFKNHSDSLLFEILNEPHGGVTPSLWNELFAEALTEIRKTNPVRVVLMGVAEFGGLGAIPQLTIPDDDYIIVTPHYYNPFQFTHQGGEWVEGSDAWLGTVWRDTDAERATIESEFNYAKYFSALHHVPIHVGEFGAYSRADLESRKRWTTFLARWFESQSFSWAYWEFSAGFGIYNPANGTLNQTLTDALLKNELPDAVPTHPTSVYSSNFSSGVDGWSLTQQQGAAGSLSASGGKLNVDITSGGSASWHLQLVKQNLKLEKEKLYRITFQGSSSGERSISFYAGKASDPWTGYSSGTVVLTPTPATFSSTFTMQSATDLQARLVFDLGMSTEKVIIGDVKLEELSTAITTAVEEQKKTTACVSPNPSADQVRLLMSIKKNQQVTVIDAAGRVVLEQKNDNEVITLAGLKPGVYVVAIDGKTYPCTRFVKR